MVTEVPWTWLPDLSLRLINISLKTNLKVVSWISLALVWQDKLLIIFPRTALLAPDS